MRGVGGPKVRIVDCGMLIEKANGLFHLTHVDISSPKTPSPLPGYVVIRSWFDKLTTNGLRHSLFVGEGRGEGN